MRKLNLKLLLWLMAGTVAAVAAVFAVHWFQSQRIAAALLWQADRAEEQGQTDRQVSYLRRYLDFCPRELGQKARLGRALASDYYANNVKMRWQALTLLNSLPPDGDPALRRDLVRVALELGGSKNARKIARDTLRSLGLDDREGDLTAPPPGMAAAEFGELMGYQGQLYELGEEPRRAVDAYRVAVRFAAQEQLNYLRLAWLLRDPQTADGDPAQRARNFSEADQVIDQLVEKNADAKDAHKAYLGRWRYRREFGLIDLGKRRTADQVELKKAVEDVAKALQRQPEAAEVLLSQADRLRLEEHRAEARKVLEKGLELQRRPGYREAADGYRFQFLWQLSNVLLDDLYDDRTAADQKSGLAAEAVQHIGQIRKIKVGASVPAAADYLEARLALHDKDWVRAERLLLNARQQLTLHRDLTGQIDLYLGKCYEQLDDPGKMYDAYNKVLGWDQNSVPAKLGMAAACWAKQTPDDLKQAQRLYWSLVEVNKLPDDGWLDLARLEVVVTAGQPEPARADWSRAELALAKAAELRPRAVDVPLLRADMLTARGDPRGAELALTNGLASKCEKKELIYSALVELAARDKRSDQALKLLADGEKALGDQAELRLARARLLVGDQSDEARKALERLAKDHERFQPEEQTRLLSGLAEVQFRRNDLAEARRLTEELAGLKQHRNDLRLQLLLFDLAQKAGDGPGMDRKLAEIAKIEGGQGVFHPYARALRLIAAAREPKAAEAERAAALDEARKLLGQIQAREKYANWLPLYRARAEIALAAGSPDRAREELKQAVKNGDKSLATAEALVKVLSRAGTHDPEADQLLDTLGPAVRASAQVKRWQATSKAASGDVAQALELAKQWMSDDPKDPEEMRWKAWFIQQTQPNDKAQMARARQLLDWAMEKAPTDPETYVALVRFLVAAHQPGEAPAVMEKAKANLKPEKVALTLAQCWEELGRTDEARKEYERALKDRPGDAAVVRAVAGFQVRTGRLRQAEELLRRLAERKVEGSAEDAAWARRGLALVLAGANDHRNFREALAQVGLKLDDDGRLPRDLKADNTELQRTRARVLAAQPQRYFRDKAVELFEGLASSGGLTPDDRYVLALLYDAGGDWPRAKETLADLVSAQYGSRQDQLRPQTAQYLAQYVQGLIRNKELAEAQRWLERLEGVEKIRNLPWGALATADLRARLLEAQGERDKALDLLRKYRTRSGASPQDVTLLLTALARQQRFEEAFDLWPEVCRACPPEAAGGLSVALLRSMKPTDEQVRKVEEWLKQAVKDHPDKPVLRMHLADMYDLRGRYDEALAEYGAVLEVEPSNVVALNNRAWLLAHRTGEESRALPLIETAVDGQGRRGDLLDTRGVVLLQLGRTDAALADLKEAVADARTPSRLFHLARAQQQARDRDGALKTLREARELGLKPDELHPVEQQACRKMLTDFGVQ
jgi:Tfp pilus assembly protein PilF